MKTLLCFASILGLAAGVSAAGAREGLTPAKVCVFAGNGPRSNGACEYMRLVASSPEMELTLVDAQMIRDGALDGQDLLVVPGGSTIAEKKDLGPLGAEKIKAFIRNGGGYLGSCAGCCLLMDETANPERGIGVIPYRRTGARRQRYMMPVRVNEKGARALGIEAKTYVSRYNGGPVLVRTTNVVAGANFEIWGTYGEDFGEPGTLPEMYGRGAMVGGTFGKGRVFGFAVHPENYRSSRELLRGAFRYVLGRDVTFPERTRKVGALVVGWMSSGIAGVESSRTMLAVDGIEGVDLFPITGSEIGRNMLDHVDVLVVPTGDECATRKGLKGLEGDLAAFVARGGKLIGWGVGAQAGITGLQAFASADEVHAEIRRLRGTPSSALMGFE